MKKIIILGAVAVLLIIGMVAMSCGSVCDNYGDCRWTRDDEGSVNSYSNRLYGICSKNSCVINDPEKGIEAFHNKKDILCNCN